jgi:hypothetical protein
MKKVAFPFLILFGEMFNPFRSQSISDIRDGYYAYNRYGGNVLSTQNSKMIFKLNPDSRTIILITTERR